MKHIIDKNLGIKIVYFNSSFFEDYIESPSSIPEEISDDFVKKFAEQIDNIKLTNEIIIWLYEIIEEQRKHFKEYYSKKYDR